MNETKTGFLRAAITLAGAAAFGPVTHGATLYPCRRVRASATFASRRSLREEIVLILLLLPIHLGARNKTGRGGFQRL
ncbi:MAG TPA: hypothetical protein VMB70_06445 [Terriglobia bacterium]|nr:hypothetical protein [Terriglobia bacterium]